MSGGDYATFADKAALIVIGCALDPLLLVQGTAWALGYRKVHADTAERA